MEFIDGADLNRLMELARECRKFPSVHQCCQIAFEMCRGLHYAHSLKIDGRAMGVVHRDVSPHNVLISRSGEIKIADFGIAKAAERLTHTATGLIKGKVAYMAPEQAGGEELDHRVDQFATGVVLWEMLTGERLFARARQAQTLKAVLDTEVLPPSHWRAGIPPELDEILLKALAQNPSDRFEHMRAMQQALGRFVHSLPPGVSDDDITAWVETLDALAPPKHTRDTAVLPPAMSEFDETLERPMESGPGNTGSVTNPTITLNLAAAESQAQTLQANLVQATLQTKPKSRTRARPLVIALTLTLVTVSGVFIYVGAQSVPQKPSVAQTVTPKPPVSNPTPRLEKGRSQAPLKPTTPVAEPSLREKKTVKASNASTGTVPPKPVATPPAQGSIFVDVVGGWAEIWWQGKKLGETPRLVQLPVGAHKLLLKNPETGVQKFQRVNVNRHKNPAVRVHLEP